VVMYDPVADSWQQMAAMPTARYSHASAVMDGKIYVSGGFTTLGELSDAFEASLRPGDEYLGNTGELERGPRRPCLCGI